MCRFFLSFLVFKIVYLFISRIEKKKNPILYIFFPSLLSNHSVYWISVQFGSVCKMTKKNRRQKKHHKLTTIDNERAKKKIARGVLMNVFINTTSAKVKQNKLTKQSKRLRRRWRRRPQRQRHNKHKEPREVTQKKYIIKYPCIFYTHTLKQFEREPTESERVSERLNKWTNERMN